MIRWTGLAPWEFEFPFPGSLTSIFLHSTSEAGGCETGVEHMFKAPRLLYHSTLGLRVIKKEKKENTESRDC